MRRFLTLLLILFASAALAEPALPDTPAARVFAAWLDAFNANDADKIKSFDETYQPKRPLAGMADFRKQTGGFTLLRVESSEAGKLVGLVKERGGEGIARLEFTVTADNPPKMGGVSARLIPPPADLATDRLSEKDALAALAKRLDDAAREDTFSGAVLIAKNGNVLLEKAVGLADREQQKAASVDTRFRLGSMNKMFTAIAILQLVEAGKLSLGDTVGKILADYPNPDIAGKVTLRHLLTHTGGTGDIFGEQFDAHRLELKTHADYVKLYGGRASLFAAGTENRYSNYGFVLLGAIIEKASGMSYYDYVRRKIFEPAGMMATDSLPESETVAGRAAGYIKQDGKWVSNRDTLPWRGTSAGGGYSTVRDLLRFADALQSGKLVSKALFAEATQNQAQNYGFGFGVRGNGNWQSYGHGGGAPGMNGELRVIPAQGYVLIALSNLDPPAATRTIDFIEARLPASS